MNKIEIYDHGESVYDRYTVVYLDCPLPRQGLYECVGMSEHPFHPQGFGQHSSAMPGDHLGQRIDFTQLPPECQQLVLSDLEAGKSRLYCNDYQLSADNLRDKYKGSTVAHLGEHPGYRRELCATKLGVDLSTSEGYWDWVKSCLFEEAQEYRELIDAGCSELDSQKDESFQPLCA